MTNNDHNLLYGKPIAEKIFQQIALETEQLKQKGIVPSLITVEVGSDPASKYYQENQKRIANQVGFRYEARQLDENTTREELLQEIERINNDPGIHGFILNQPLPDHLDANEMRWHIRGSKDVEGVTPENMGRLFLGLEGLRPCTAVAIVEMIKASGVDIRGKEVTVIGRSNTVGKPASILLLGESGTVTTCHSYTSRAGRIEEHVQNAEILVAAIGSAEFVKGEWIRKGAIVIDAGINYKDGKMVGDVEFDAAREKAAFITPVPGGVGTVTTAILMQNTLAAVKMQAGK